MERTLEKATIIRAAFDLLSDQGLDSFLNKEGRGKAGGAATFALLAFPKQVLPVVSHGGRYAGTWGSAFYAPTR